MYRFVHTQHDGLEAREGTGEWQAGSSGEFFQKGGGSVEYDCISQRGGDA